MFVPASSESSSGPSRTRRITRACDRCHHANIRCVKGLEDSACKTCVEFGEPCTYDRPIRRRGPRPGARRPSTNTREDDHGSNESAWQYSAPVDFEAIETLVEGYRTIVYPIFPIFHWPSFIKDVKSRRYTTDRSFYIITMTICAIVSDRLEHGAIVYPAPSTTSPLADTYSFHRLAVDAFPRNLHDAREFNYKRGKALMAILGVQYGDVGELMVHLGDYGTLSMRDGFYDETRWSKGLTHPEMEERRRLFWSTYTLEIFSAITWGGLVRHRQSQCNVNYPAEVIDDHDITDSQITLPHDASANSFIHGWNVTTDMYRVLEHLVDRLGARRRLDERFTSPISELLRPRHPGPSSEEILETVQGIYDNLSPIFKSVHAMIGNAEVDRFGFQAANLIVTLHTVKMVLASTEESSIEKRCAIAGTLLDALATIPTSYIAAISAPMLHHLASVGHLLASVISSPLTQWSFLQVRNVIFAMSNLISGLESVLLIKSEISLRLKAHVATIDEKMRKAAVEAERKQVYHSALPVLGGSNDNNNNNNNIDSHPSISLSASPPATLTDTNGMGLVGAADAGMDWIFGFSPDQTLQLQSDLTMNWPFDIGSNGLTDMWGDFDAGQGSNQGQGSQDVNHHL